MAASTADLLDSILEEFEQIKTIKPEDIPNMDLYMDQVQSFMEENLHIFTRCPRGDPFMTKTMINHYVKSGLLPSPIKKKYSKEHMLLLIYICFFKRFLTISEIQILLKPVTERCFGSNKGLKLETVYRETLALVEEQAEFLKRDIVQKLDKTENIFAGVPETEQELLKEFSLICMLSFDVSTKKMIIEMLIDDMTEYSANRDTDE